MCIPPNVREIELARPIVGIGHEFVLIKGVRLCLAVWIIGDPPRLVDIFHRFPIQDFILAIGVVISGRSLFMHQVYCFCNKLRQAFLSQASSLGVQEHLHIGCEHNHRDRLRAFRGYDNPRVALHLMHLPRQAERMAYRDLWI